MSLTPLVRSARRTVCAALMVVSVALLVAAPAAFAQTSEVTREDCERGNITRNGRTLSREECERLIGQRVRTASTGFEVWAVGLVGVMCLGGAVVLIRRRRSHGGATIA